MEQFQFSSISTTSNSEDQSSNNELHFTKQYQTKRKRQKKKKSKSAAPHIPRKKKNTIVEKEETISNNSTEPPPKSCNEENLDPKVKQLEEHCFEMQEAMESFRNELQEVINVVEWNHEQQQKLLELHEISETKQHTVQPETSLEKPKTENQQNDQQQSSKEEIVKLKSALKKMHQRHLVALSKVGELEARMKHMESSPKNSSPLSNNEGIEYTKKMCDAYASTVSEHMHEYSSRLEDTSRLVRSLETKFQEVEENVETIRKSVDQKFDNLRSQVSKLEETANSLPSSISTSSSSPDSKRIGQESFSSAYAEALKNTETNLKRLSKMMERSHKSLHAHLCDVEKYALKLGKDMSCTFDERLQQTVSGFESKFKEKFQQGENSKVQVLESEIEKLKIAFHSELDNIKRLREEVKFS